MGIIQGTAFLALAGCIAPTTWGLLTDGALPPPGRAEVLVAGGVAAAIDGGDVTDPGVGGMVQVGVTDRVAVAGGLGGVGDLATGTVEVRGRLTPPQAPVAITALGGAGAWMPLDSDAEAVGGVHLGALASLPVGPDLRPFLGAKVNPVFQPNGDTEAFTQATAGISWSPALGPAWRLRLGMEASAVILATQEEADPFWEAGLWAGVARTP